MYCGVFTQLYRETKLKDARLLRPCEKDAATRGCAHTQNRKELRIPEFSWMILYSTIEQYLELVDIAFLRS
jgi:hypothetical protein